MNWGQEMKMLALTILLMATFSKSDDCSLGTDGGNAFVEYDKDIEMSKEDIVLNMSQDSAIVKCKFWFYNGSEEKVRTVGFPNWWSSPPSASEEIHNFKTWISGKEVKVHSKFQSIVEVEGKDTLPDEDKEWFVWETKFVKKDTTIIENQYTAKYRGCNCTREKSLTYVLGTGRSWKNSIGNGKIVFNFENSLSELWFKEPILPSPRLKGINSKDHLEVEFEGYEPQQDDYIRLDFFSPWETMCALQNDSAFTNFLLGKSRKQLKEMRNEIFARHGYIFMDAELSKLFSGKSWYKPKKEFAVSMISKVEKETIDEIRKIEERK
jgi:hypothetical protein